MAAKSGFAMMKELLQHIHVQRLFRFILGAVFIYASIDKIANPQEFSDLIDNYHISPIQVNNLAALFIAEQRPMLVSEFVYL